MLTWRTRPCNCYCNRVARALRVCDSDKGQSGDPGLQHRAGDISEYSDETEYTFSTLAVQPVHGICTTRARSSVHAAHTEQLSAISPALPRLCVMGTVRVRLSH